jgi:hypothetical protein
VLGSYTVSALRAEAASQREKRVARRIVSSLFDHPDWTSLPEKEFIKRFLKENEDVSYADVKQAFRGSGWTSKLAAMTEPTEAGAEAQPGERGGVAGQSFAPAMFGD